MSNQSPEEPTIGQLMSAAVSDLSNIVSSQVELAKAEIHQSVQKGTAAGIAGVVAAVAAFFTVLFLLVTLAYVLIQLGLPAWASFGIITVILLIVTAVFGLIAKKKLEGVQGPKQTIESIETTKSELMAAAKPSDKVAPKQVVPSNSAPKQPVPQQQAVPNKPAVGQGPSPAKGKL